MRRAFFLAMFLANAAGAFGPGPAVECRFAAFDCDGKIGLDEWVPFPIVGPGAFVKGSFEPYKIRISTDLSAFEINIRLEGELISRMNFPLVQIADLPVGATIFGISSVVHEEVEGFESIQYECRKVF